ncbi:hypothetical protein D7030_04200 [Flavobacteriaceae bacterium AU392]|nr:hypothetical protein D1817_10675 [Flavobacteriaceae bacterium]RKM85879.1 hypothetical protein D7030_04200 [Flavobacteriaceae bacterium AU392]
MKTLFIIILSLFLVNISYAQSEVDKKAIRKACMNYLEGFYEGDTLKIVNSIRPSLYKFGYWKNKESSSYKGAQMTYKQAIAYAKGVFEKKNFAKKDAPKKVEILNIMNHIAAAKITAWWGVDYALLSKDGDKWMIEQVLWEGPPR